MFYRKDDVEVYYETAGRGVPLLILHGFTIDHRALEGCIEPVLARKSGWKRFYVDLPGMGRSRAPKARNSDDMLGILVDFIESKLPAGRPFAVIGESYGGYLARGLVNRMPERIAGLFLLCPVAHPLAKDRKVAPFEVRHRDTRFFDRLKSPFKADFESMAVIQNVKAWKRFLDEIACGLKIHDAAFCDALQRNGYGLSFDVDALARPFDKPTTILVGRQDQVVGFEDHWELLRTYPRASFAALDCAGHNLHLDQELVFRTLFLEWLGRMALSQ